MNMELRKVRLGDIGKIVTGKTPSTKNEEFFSGDIPFITPEDIACGFRIDDSLRHLSQDGLDSIKSNSLNGFSVLVGCIGSDMGNVAYSEKKCATNQQINSITDINENFDPLFVYYLLSTKKNHLRQMAGSTTTPLLPKSVFESIEYYFPSFPEQKKIAAVLSALDEKITLNKKMNQKLEAMAKRLYDYWFVQFDFPDENGRPYKTSGGPMVYNETLKREIPTGWDVKKICDLSVFEKESTRPSSNPNVLYKHFSIPGFDECGSYVFEKGCDILSDKFIVTDSSILVSKLNPWTSRVVWGENLEDSICSTEFVVMKLNSLCDKGFLYMLVKQPSFIDYCTRGSSGTSHSHRRVNPEFMMNFMFAYNESIVRKFSAIASQYAQMIVKNLRENRSLSALRDKLLPLLMNGQVVVG